jgi:hypothetical protein
MYKFKIKSSQVLIFNKFTSTHLEFAHLIFHSINNHCMIHLMRNIQVSLRIMKTEIIAYQKVVHATFLSSYNSQNMQLLKPVKIYCPFAKRVSQLKILDFSGNILKI